MSRRGGQNADKRTGRAAKRSKRQFPDGVCWIADRAMTTKAPIHVSEMPIGQESPVKGPECPRGLTSARATQQVLAILAHPQSIADAFREAVTRGAALAREGNHEAAAAAFAQACDLMPQSASAWRALGDMRFALGDWARSNEAHLRSIECPPDARLAAALAATGEGQFAQAYTLLRERLAATPTDIAALSAMADLALRTGQAADAAGLLDRALERAPGFGRAWLQLATALDQLSAADALTTIQRQRQKRPDIWGYRTLEAGMLERTGDYDGALAMLEAMLAERPDDAGAMLLLGHVLRTLGRTSDAVAAYRRAAALQPASGEAWWALADIKSFRFTGADVEALARLRDQCAAPLDRAHAEFALGRAYELRGDHANAFAHYAEGNQIKRATITHDPAAMNRDLERMSAVFTPEFYAARHGWGCQARDPVFIVGMPRSGSTLVEQILASHPAIEATRELTDLPAMVRGLAVSASARGATYPAMLDQLSETEVEALGKQYIEQTRCHRRTERPFFIDKLPANFSHIGLIRLILPNARVIDVRRDPVACGYSIFRQNFASGHGYAYDLGDIAAHYASYRATMALWHERLPGLVHHVRYETLIADLEGETRKLLAYLDLPFDPACLTFFETRRPIRTPSGEQVRGPVNRDGLESWRAYVQWLTPLMDLRA
jgi:tetratricopeptide (TPR) repeat protein